MNSTLLPTTKEIRTIVEDEMNAAGGTISDCCDDGRDLFLRTILPEVRHVRPRDAVQGGVAVMAVGPEIRVHPYTFREVCRNGAIMAQAIQTRVVERVDAGSPAYGVDQVLCRLSEAVRECSSAEAFAVSVDQMRSAAERVADGVLNVIPWLSRLSKELAPTLLRHIKQQFRSTGDHTAFGVMNAVTSVARDQRDPQVRWRLEELGGSVPALLGPTWHPHESAAGLLPV